MLQPIYRGKTYKFDIEIKVNGIVADVSPDTVTLRLDTKSNVETPVITKEADVSTGTASFELLPAETILLVEQNYIAQVEWVINLGMFPPPSPRTFIVLDENVKIKPVIK